MTTITIDRSVVEQALEALENGKRVRAYEGGTKCQISLEGSAIPALRAALAESREHVTDGSPCWCNPETTYVDPDTGASVIVHKEPQ